MLPVCSALPWRNGIRQRYLPNRRKERRSVNQTAGIKFTITVKLVDAYFNKVNGTPDVWIETTDIYDVQPSTGPLNTGSQTYQPMLVTIHASLKAMSHIIQVRRVPFHHRLFNTDEIAGDFTGETSVPKPPYTDNTGGKQARHQQKLQVKVFTSPSMRQMISGTRLWTTRKVLRMLELHRLTRYFASFARDNTLNEATAYSICQTV